MGRGCGPAKDHGRKVIGAGGERKKKKRKEGGSENIVTRCRVTPATPGPVSRIRPHHLTEEVKSKEVLKGRARGC